MAISRSRTARAVCWGYATRFRPPFWSACDDGAKKISGAGDESRNRSVLGSGQTRQIPDQALHRVRRGALFSALDLSVVLFRKDGVGGELGRGHDLYLQPDAQIGQRTLRDRLCHLEGGPFAADQFRRLRHGQVEDRPEGQGGVQADRRRAAAVLHAGVVRWARGAPSNSWSSPRKRGSSKRR